MSSDFEKYRWLGTEDLRDDPENGQLDGQVLNRVFDFLDL